MRIDDLFRRHQAELFRFASRFTGDADLAEDVVQDAFVRLAERPPRDTSQVRAWLYRVATTLAIDALRGTRRRRALVAEHPHDVPHGGPAPDPLRDAERDELRATVRVALDGLGEKERAVLLMHEEGFSHREIAAAIGTTTGSVGTMFARALEKLASRLDLDAEDVR